MATLEDSDIQDLVTGTLKHLGRLKFNQIATRLQNYEVMGRIMKKDKVQFDDGYAIQRTLMVDHSAAAKQVGLYETDTVNVADVLQTISIPWRHTTTNYAYERRELLMNRGASRIVNLLKVRRVDAMIALAELMEDEFWDKPADSTDKLHLMGVPYWLVKAASSEGFNGGNPSGFSSGAGGLNATTYTRWKNYNALFTAITKTDCIRKMRTAHRKIQFRSPVDIPDFRRGNGQQFRIYTGEENLQDFEDLGEAQNENLSRDLASMDGVMTFRRNPIIWVPKLDAEHDAQKPIYMLNYAWFYPVFLRGDYLREAAPAKASEQHNTWNVFVDLTWNVLCTDRRSQAVLNIA